MDVTVNNEVKGQQATRVKTQTAAMFGLDARIALAIFGALSVISGAALYSAIQQSKVTATIASMNEVSKAIEQFALDTGQDVSTDKSIIGASATSKLVENTGITGWAGPYLSYTKINSDRIESDGVYGVYARVATNGPWGHPNDNSNAEHCASSSKPCYAWVLFSGVPASLRKAIDIAVDGTDSATTGKLRYTSLYSGEVYFQSMLVLNDI